MVLLGAITLYPNDPLPKYEEIPLTLSANSPTQNQAASTKKTNTSIAANTNATTAETPKTEAKLAAIAAQEKAAKEAELAAQLGIWHSVKIKAGDNLSTLFASQKLSAASVLALANTPTYGKALERIRPSETLEFRINKMGELTQLRYVQNKLDSILFKKTDSGYQGEKISLTPDIKTMYAGGTIENSLFVASQKAGLSQNLTMKLAEIFGWDIDFVQGIRKGDSFQVLYEKKFIDGDELGDGNILAATFVNQSKTYSAIRYTDSDGDSNYYTPEGNSMKKAFLRTPVDFTRISSKFNPDRLHPVFKTKRPHRGVDYAAPMNTPIKAAGDGRIKFSGWQKGYGNVVYIEHPNNIVTVYAHANKLVKLKKGARVKQGQTIAYVGKTGWATGPHLHYEFQVNGVHRNPMTVKLPDAAPISKKEMAHFKEVASVTLAQMGSQRKTVLAQNE